MNEMNIINPTVEQESRLGEVLGLGDPYAYDPSDPVKRDEIIRVIGMTLEAASALRECARRCVSLSESLQRLTEDAEHGSVQFCGSGMSIVYKEVHLYSGIRTLAEILGVPEGEVHLVSRGNDEEYPYELHFHCGGLKYFQLMKTKDGDNKNRIGEV